MRYATFSVGSDRSHRLGIVQGDRVIDAATLAAGAWADPFPRTVLELVQQGPAGWARMSELAARAASGTSYAASDIAWHAPIPRPAKNIFCLGLNYASHARESAQARGREAKIPTDPVFFTKAPTTVNDPYGDIRVDRAVTTQVDWEAELGVVIGRGGTNIARADALGHVFGYTVINDTTARDLQARHFQWFKGKSLDTFCPMGPVVVTADEFGDPQRKQVMLTVNGVLKQHATTADMIFPVDVIIEVLSRGMTLEAGDVIATGTPEGVGMGRTPPEYLHDGDLVETEIEGIGVLRNRIRDVTEPPRA
jgi:2-keto-4-pentenoate hydratase/2-oxohepta-3-ene-1,7-dioic acid hydratase in catechol pathway